MNPITMCQEVERGEKTRPLLAFSYLFAPLLHVGMKREREKKKTGIKINEVIVKSHPKKKVCC